MKKAIFLLLPLFAFTGKEPNSQVQTSKIKTQTSISTPLNQRFSISNFKFRTSNFESQISNLEPANCQLPTTSTLALTLAPTLNFAPAPHAWGFFAHKRINRMAVFTLPEGMLGFYKSKIEFVTEHAVDPDKRRYAVKEEAARHYIDIDHYGNDSTSAFDVVPEKWEDAVKKFTEDTLQAYGIVPWHLQVMMYKLTKAFKDENIDLILKYSADIGHYIGDAHVPLHTTENYNGQLTGQKGIHGFWESRIPELFSEEYDFFIGKAEYIDNTLKYSWKTVKDSHYAVDSVLTFEKLLNDEFPTDQKYSYEERGRNTMKTYSAEYTKEYSDRLDGMVERRMRKAIISVGCYWYTAWVNAGKPDLDKLIGKEISTTLQEELNETDKNYEKDKSSGKVKGHED